MTSRARLDLSAALADLADQAGMYADPDRAIVAARPRRATRLAMSSCAAAVAMVLGGVSCLPPAADRGGVAPPAVSEPAGDVPPHLRALYPPTVDPRPNAPYLRPPTDPLPAAATLLYAPCPRGDCWPNLVLPDGTQYRVPENRPQNGRPRDLTLSPDGRYAGWGYQEDGWYYVVDLRTGVKTQVTDDRGRSPTLPLPPQWDTHTSAWVWSPDSRWLLLAAHRDGDVARYFLLEMRGERPGDGYRELPASVAGPDGSVIGVRNNGDLLVWAASPGGQLPVLRVANPVTSQSRTVTPPAAAGLLVEGERVLGLLMSPCDCAVWFTVFAPGETGRPTALLGMDLTDGHLTGRINLPRSAESGGQQPGVWSAQASLPGGIALVRHHPGGTDIEILNDVTGERFLVTRLPADTHVVLRGQARY